MSWTASVLVMSILLVLTSMHVCAALHNRLAREVEGDEEDDDQDPDVMMGTQPGARVQSSQVEAVKKAALLMDYPLMEEYDFRSMFTTVEFSYVK
eukprot:1221-Heterococcus_DN1.PRE.3